MDLVWFAIVLEMEYLKGSIHYLNMYALPLALLLWFSSLTTAQNSILLYTLQEELPPNTLIADISTDSGIKDELSPEVIKQLKYSFLDTPSVDMSGHESKQYFKILESKGFLKTTMSIDRDKLCPKQPTCTLTLEVAISPAQYFRIITVSIDITDLNDNKPKFLENSIAVNVIESAQVNSVVALLPSGFDPDSNSYGISDYKLETLNPDTQTWHSNVFSLQEKQGLDGSTELKLVLLKPLDRERIAFYQLQVTAYDGVVPPQMGTLLVNVTILDTNDNPPVFFAESYSVDIPENTKVNWTITTVSAYDADIGPNGHIVFGFTARTEENLGDIFGIDPNRGEIYLKSRVDFEMGSTYQLVVTASDKGSNTMTSQVAVVVNVLDVNDFKPQITINSLSESGQPEVLEHVPKGTFVAYVSVIDLDSGLNGEVTCRLNTTYFKLSNMQKSRYTVVTDAIFDREIIDKYTVGLTCVDKGTPSLSSTKTFTVNILDVNDQPPIFKKSLYMTNLEENNSPNAFLLQVHATDKDIGHNGLVVFGLSPGNSRELNSLFEIDTNGVLRAKGILDHEQYETVTFKIIALDRGQPVQTATAQVSIEILDVNDCKPRFTVPAYSFGLYENELPGVHIGNVVAIDEDGEPYNKVSYRLEADDYHTLENFQINASNGLIKSEYSLDREKETTYYLKVIAFNPGFPGMSGSTSVTIYLSDDNDNSPIIDFPTLENNTVYVNDNVKPGYVITRIRANDLDTGENARLTYELIKVMGDNTNYNVSKESREGGKVYKDRMITNAIFNLDKRTGALTVMEKIPLSPEINRYNLAIVVKDHGYPNNRKTTTYLTVICEHGVGTGAIIDYEYSADNIDSAALNKKRMPNLTIVIAVACGSTLVIVILILLIILLSYRGKKGRRAPQQQGQYNCRVEGQRMLNGNISRARPDSSPTHSTDCEVPTHPDYQHTALNHDDSGRGLSISDQMPEPATGGQHRLWASPNQTQNDVVLNHTPPNTCVVTLENNDQFSTRLMPLTDKEIEIHKIVKFLHSQQDHDTGCDSHFDSLSTSDSGKGASDNGDLASDVPYNTNSMNKHTLQGKHHYNVPTHHNSYASNGKRIPQPDAIHGYQIDNSQPRYGYNSVTCNRIEPKSLYSSTSHNMDNSLYSVLNKPSKQVTFSTTLPKQNNTSNNYTATNTQGGNIVGVKSQMSTFSSLPGQTEQVVDNRGFERKIIKPLNIKHGYKETSFDDGDSVNFNHSDNKQSGNIINSKYGGIGVVRPIQKKQLYPNTYNSSIKQPTGVNQDAHKTVSSNNPNSISDNLPPPPPPYKYPNGSTDSVSLNGQLSDFELLQDSVV